MVYRSHFDAVEFAGYDRSELPDYVYRIEHIGTQSRHDLHTHDYVAADDNCKFPNLATLEKYIENHLDWQCREPSPFLSGFTSRTDALNWAKVKLTDDHDSFYSIRLVTIDVNMVRNAPGSDRLPILSVFKLWDQIDIHPHLRPKNEEVLFMYRIPAKAVISVQRLGDLVDHSGTWCRHHLIKIRC